MDTIQIYVAITYSLVVTLHEIMFALDDSTISNRKALHLVNTFIDAWGKLGIKHSVYVTPSALQAIMSRFPDDLSYGISVCTSTLLCAMRSDTMVAPYFHKITSLQNRAISNDMGIVQSNHTYSQSPLNLDPLQALTAKGQTNGNYDYLAGNGTLHPNCDYWELFRLALSGTSDPRYTQSYLLILSTAHWR